MIISELQILLDINEGNEQAVLEEHASRTMYGYLFVDSEDGQCQLFDRNGKLDDVNKFKEMPSGYVKKDVKKIAIPKSVKSIGVYAFEDCTSLKSIEIPNSVKSIEYGTFFNCTSLTSIKIPESVKSIKCGAFERYTSLEEVSFKGKTFEQVKAMDGYPWGIEDKAIIKCS